MISKTCQMIENSVRFFKIINYIHKLIPLINSLNLYLMIPLFFISYSYIKVKSLFLNLVKYWISTFPFTFTNNLTGGMRYNFVWVDNDDFPFFIDCSDAQQIISGNQCLSIIVLQFWTT